MTICALIVTSVKTIKVPLSVCVYTTDFLIHCLSQGEMDGAEIEAHVKGQ